VRAGAGGKEDNLVHVCSRSACMQTWVFISVHTCCSSDTDDVHATVVFVAFLSHPLSHADI